MWRRFSIFIATATVIIGTVYLAFVSDVATPRSSSTMRGVFDTFNSIPPTTFKALSAASKSKFGEAAEIDRVSTGIEVKLGGKIVATESVPFRFYEAFGATEIVEPSGTAVVFPFYVSPYEPRPKPYPDLVRRVDHFLGQFFQPNQLDLNEKEFEIEPCHAISAKEFGIALRLLSISDSVVCGVVSKREPSRRMLVGVVSADGGRWIRSFVRGACRMLSGTWMARDRQLHNGRRPDYLQCMIADRPENTPTGSGLSALVYDIRSDGTLARIEGAPKALITYPLQPDPSIPTFQKASPEPASAPPNAAAQNPDARLPVFKPVPPEESERARREAEVQQPQASPPAQEPETPADRVRALNKLVIEHANDLYEQPCNEKAKADYVEVAVYYAESWLIDMPCLEKENCSAADRRRSEMLSQTLGSPWQPDVMAAMKRAHQIVAFRSSDFPADTQAFLAKLADDPAINPQADPAAQDSSLRESLRRSLLPDGCPASNRQ